MTPTQLNALRQACLADQNAAPFLAAPGNSAGLLAYLNGNHTESIWRSDAPTAAIENAVDWLLYDVQGSYADSLTALLFPQLSAREDKASNKLHVFSIITKYDTVNAALPNIRKGLRNAVTNVPTNTEGSVRQPGGASGANVLSKCIRLGRRCEIMLAVTSTPADDTVGGITARTPTWEGEVTPNEATALIFNADGTIRSA